jgi:hypothetical protein
MSEAQPSSTRIWRHNKEKVSSAAENPTEKVKVRGADYSEGDRERQDLFNALRDAKPTDHGKPTPSTPKALEQAIERKPPEIPPPPFNPVDAEEAAGDEGGGGGGGGGGPTGPGEWYSLTLCDSTVIEVWKKV